MGNKKISDLTPASSVSNIDQLVVSQGAGAGQTRSSTLAVLKTWILTWVSGGTWGSITGTLSAQSDLATALAAKESAANKGAANGYASLDGTGKLPSSQFPAGVDEVKEYANLAAFPATGAANIIYLALDTGFIYRWTGSTYLQVAGGGGGLSSTDFGTWTAMPSSSGQMINANFPLSYKLDLSAFSPKTIVYIQGQFGLNASFFGISLLLGVLPTGSRPAAQVKKYFIFQNIEMFLQVDTNGNVSLISKDAFNLPVTTGTPEIQPYYLDIFFLAS